MLKGAKKADAASSDPGTSGAQKMPKEAAKSKKKADGSPEEPLENDDLTTCCHRITLCNPRMRETPVTNVVFSIRGREVTWATLFWLTTIAVLVLLGWMVLFFLLGDTMLPGGPSFGLFLLVVFAYFLGWALTVIPYLNIPPICGMLLAGMIMRNTGLYNIYEELGVRTTSKIRTFCLTFVMIRAGLQVTTTALKTHGILIIILALVPCSVELSVVSFCCRYLLDYPWDWSIMSGIVVTSMSPVVVMNGMLNLAERGYGEDKGLTTLLSTAATIDDIHILWLFSTLYSVVFRNGAPSHEIDEPHSRHHESWTYFLGGLRDLAAGLFAGVVLGLCLTFFPHRNDKHAIWYRMIGLVLASLACTTSASRIGFTGGGFLATLVLAFVAIKGWKVQSPSFDTGPLRHAAYIMWHLVQPILVGVIGADIDFRTWSAERFSLHLGCIVCGLAARSASALLVTLRSPFTWRERIFVVVAWLPKGTMQALLAPMAYERAKDAKDPEAIKLALDLLRISVIAIVFLAALGSILISTTGPLLLNKISMEEELKERQLSYLRIISLQPVRNLPTREQLPTIRE